MVAETRIPLGVAASDDTSTRVYALGEACSRSQRRGQQQGVLAETPAAMRARVQMRARRHGRRRCELACGREGMSARLQRAEHRFFGHHWRSAGRTAQATRQGTGGGAHARKLALAPHANAKLLVSPVIRPSVEMVSSKQNRFLFFSSLSSKLS